MTISDPIEPSEECDCADRAPHGRDWICPKCDAEWLAEEDDKE